eukprot:scaffold34556_cov129-Isochrysis_galbana.AAC.2
MSGRWGDEREMSWRWGDEREMSGRWGDEREMSGSAVLARPVVSRATRVQEEGVDGYASSSAGRACEAPGWGKWAG